MTPAEFHNFKWHPNHWMVVGMFSVTAFVLILPTGAASASILLTCSIIYLIFHSSEKFSVKCLNACERCFLVSMALYPVSVTLSIYFSGQSSAWHYLDNPSRFLLAPLVYLAIRKSGATPVGLVTGAILGASSAGVLAMVQWTLLEIPRPGGLVNPIPFADITLLLVLMALAPISLPKPWRALRPLGVALGMTAVLLAQTRGAWIAIPFLAWLAMEWFPGRWSNITRHCLLTMMVGGLLLTGVVMLSKSFSMTLGSWGVPLTPMRVDSLLVRIETWQAALTLLYERPWAGVGVGQYAVEARTILERTGLSTEHLKSAMTHAHNDFLHLGATMGILGILSYLLPLALIYHAGRILCRQRCLTMGVLLKLLAVAQGIFSLTQTQLSHNISTTFFAVSAAALVALGFNTVVRDPPDRHARSEGYDRDPST